MRDSIFTLAVSASKTVWIKFSPMHNVAHNSEMVIFNNSHRGNVSVDLRGQGKYSKSYYSHTENLTEQTLKDTLQAITGRGYVQLGYNSNARDKMFMNVDNKKVNGQGATTNTLECVYTGREAIGYTSRANCQSAFSFNTEHTYPQTYFSNAEPMLSDLHHLFPTDNAANGIRSSYRFGTVTGTPSWAVGGSKFGGVFFEPRDEHKGEVARAMFYFVVRYQNFQGFLDTQESTLRYWLKLFPPSTIEKKRDADIFALQKNHNPFIDYPQFVYRITSISNASSSTVLAKIDETDSVIDYGLVTPANVYTYNFVMVNNGNKVINFTNFTLSNPAILSFAGSSGSNSTLQPGEALDVMVNIQTTNTDSLVEHLFFDTDVPSAATFDVPIFANFYSSPLATTNIVSDEMEMNLYPNPSNNNVTIEYAWKKSTDGNLEVYNMMGERILSQKLPHSQTATQLDISTLAQGIYTCKLSNGNMQEFKKLVIVR